MMRFGLRVSTAICAFALAVTCAVPALAHNFCGDGSKNSNEECDPGGELRCNGDPSQPICRNGSDCPSGVNCYFALSCCKFNCEYVGQGATCFDGDDCSGPDRCNNIGQCVGSPKSGNPCNDDNTCTGNDVCVNGDCIGSLPEECDDHNPCTDDVCDPETGCGHEVNYGPCDDNQLCTTNDRCDEGGCRGDPTVPAGCTDSNTCTDDGCNPEANNGHGACLHEPNEDPCSDGQFCTKEDRCVDGHCTGTPFTPPSCIDSNVCTDDFCNPAGNGGNGACGRTNNTTPCNDGKFCTTDDRCSAGQCAAGSQLSCNDGIVCTLDTCDEARDVCVNAGDPSKSGQPCNDSNMCTGSDVCNATGGCIGAPVVCNDDNNSCTADTCNPVSGCAYDVVVESPACGSCTDGADNDGDGDTDAEDCGCNLLCETFHYAVVANRDSTRRTAYFGKDTRAARGFDPDQGSSNSSAPYPLGPSTASACSQGKLELVERSAIDGTGIASTRAEFGDGEHMRLGFFAGLVPPGQVTTTGIPPFVGPRTICSDTPIACTDDSDCPPTEACRPVMTLTETGNGFVDLTGTHPEFVDCDAAKASLPLDFATLFALTPTQDLGNLRYKDGDPPIVVTGPGTHVVHIAALRIENGVVLPIVADEQTEAVIIQIDRAFTLGVRARVELQGGLQPDHVLWLVDRRGRAYIGNQEAEPASDDVATLPGTMLAPEKNIVVGKKARVAGALLGRQVQLNEKAVVSHRPFIAAVP